jgi:hypothetical protein
MAEQLPPIPSGAYTYPDPYLSLWQSAATEVRSSEGYAESVSALGRAVDLMSPVHTVYAVVNEGMESAAELFGLDAEPEGIGQDCAKLASKFLWAEVTKNHEKAQLYADELNKSVCDVGGWSTCLATYLKFKADGGAWPYRKGLDVAFSLKGSVIALVGDWGTGEHAASSLLNEIEKLSPDVVIHLGDIYYSGTKDEARGNFLSICRQILGPDLPVFTLCGNHDMYSGGSGYYWLVDQLKQEASYFCLRNDQWQLLAMDTGHNDNNPFTVSTNMTSIAATEQAWLKDKLASAGDRRTILLSHHQLFSAFGSVGRIEGRDYAYNPNLYAGFQDVLNKVDWWFWGHEHNLAIYNPYIGLKRGRCLGCSAVPVLVSQQSYALRTDLETLRPREYPSWRINAQLGNNGSVYGHAFAIITLKADQATVEYYEVPVGGSAKLLYAE